MTATGPTGAPVATGYAVRGGVDVFALIVRRLADEGQIVMGGGVDEQYV